MIERKRPQDLDRMRQAGRVVAHVLATVQDHAAVGVSLLELDELAASVMADAGARSSFLHYHPDWAPTPYPAVLCTSVNDAVVHGLPTRYRLADGDLVSVDCAVSVDGWHGDAAVSFIVGHEDPADRKLIDDTERALAAGIAAARVGNRLGDIGHAIAAVGRSQGYGLLQGHGGHGIGRAMHEDPHVPNEGRPGKGWPLRPGLVLALEPMFIGGGDDRFWTDVDGWTRRSGDGSRAAHVEHTVAITEDGPVVLTAP